MGDDKRSRSGGGEPQQQQQQAPRLRCGCIHLVVLQASGSTLSEASSDEDRYHVNIGLGAQNLQTSAKSCRSKTRSLTWNQEFDIDVFDPKLPLELSFWRNNEKLGRKFVPVEHVPVNRAFEKWYQLYSCCSGLSQTPQRGRTFNVILLIRLHYRLMQFESFLPHPTSLRLSSGNRLTIFPRKSISRKSPVETPSQLNFIDYFLVLGRSPPEDNYDDDDEEEEDGSEPRIGNGAKILQRLPQEDRADVPLPPHIALFCFPEASGINAVSNAPEPICYSFSCIQENSASRIYGTALTFYEEQRSTRSTTKASSSSSSSSIDQQQRFTPRTLCLLSRVPFYTQFRIVLSALLELHLRQQLLLNPKEQERDSLPSLGGLLQLLVSHVPLPVAGGPPLHLCLLQQRHHIRLSLPSKFYDFPLLDLPLRQLFSLLDLNTVLRCVCCILCEMKLVVHSARHSLPALVIESLLALCFPFVWCHLCLPLLPHDLLNVLESPVPFIIGVNSRHLSERRRRLLSSDCVVLDIDDSSVELLNPLALQLPLEASKQLRRSLRRVLVPQLSTNDRVVVHLQPVGEDVETEGEPQFKCDEEQERFNRDVRVLWLRFLSDVLQDYRQFLFFVHAETPIFNTAMYLQSHAQERHVPFLSRLTSTLMFQNFLEAHLKSSNFFEDLVVYTSEDSSRDSAQAFDRVEPVALETLLKPQSKTAITTRTSSSSDPLHFFSETDSKIDVSIEPLQTALTMARPRRVSSEDSLTYTSSELRAKSKREALKSSESNRLFVCVDGLLSNSVCAFGELAAVAELLSIARWRTAFTAQLCACVVSSADNVAASSRGTKAEEQKPKQHNTLLTKGTFDALVFLVNIAADQCALVADYVNAKHLLDASDMFLCDVDPLLSQRSPRAVPDEAHPQRQQPPPKALFHRPKSMFDMLRKCQIWRDTRFWDYVFDEELSLPPPHFEESHECSNEFAFSVISSICYTMLNLRLSSDMTTAVVIRLCTISRFSEESIVTLLQLVNNVAKCVEPVEESA